MERKSMIVAVHLLLIKDGKLLMMRRYNTGYEDGNYSLCAGHIDGGEVYHEAMKREAKEELGIQISDDQLKTVQVMHRKSKDERIDYFFTAESWQGSVKNMEEDKCDELKWFDIDELPENTVAYIKYGIKEYLKGETFTSYGWL